MLHRFRNWVFALGAFALAWVLHPIWSRNLEYAIEQRGWEKALDAAIGVVPEWVGATFGWLRLDGFWGGAAAVLLVWGSLETTYAVQRRRSGTAAVPDGLDRDRPVTIYGQQVGELSNRDLANRVSLFNLKLGTARGKDLMRKYEATKTLDRTLLKRRISNTLDPEKREKLRSELDDMEAYAREWEAADAERRTSEFKVLFTTEAIDLRNELSRRTGVPVGGGADPTRAILEDGCVSDDTMRALSSSLSDMTERLPR